MLTQVNIADLLDIPELKIVIQNWVLGKAFIFRKTPAIFTIVEVNTECKQRNAVLITV